MKKLRLILPLAAAILAFAACDDDDNTYDFAQIYYPGGGTVIYADQTTDSLKFATTYDYELEVSEDWLTIEADSLSENVPDGYYVVREYLVRIEPNTTDTMRRAYVYFYADGRTLSTYYYQYHYLDIDRPSRSNYQFALTDSATQVRDSIIFTTYNDDWTLAFEEEQSWIRFATDAETTGEAGSYTVFYEMDENTTSSSRSAVLKLTSEGVTTEISVTQSGTE